MLEFPANKRNIACRSNCQMYDSMKATVNQNWIVSFIVIRFTALDIVQHNPGFKGHLTFMTNHFDSNKVITVHTCVIRIRQCKGNNAFVGRLLSWEN